MKCFLKVLYMSTAFHLITVMCFEDFLSVKLLEKYDN